MVAGSLTLLPDHQASELWASVLQAMASRISTISRDSLTRHTRCLGLTPSTLRVAATAHELSNWARDGQLAALEAALAHLGEDVYELAILPVDDASSLTRDPSRTFSRFIVGPSNERIRERAAQFVASPRSEDGLLVLHGSASSGKTHLLHAIGHALDKASGYDGALLRRAEDISLDLINAIWNDDLAGFRERLQGASALLIDDMQALSGRDATQEELLQTIDVMREREIPVVVAATRPPGRLSGLIAPLRDRLDRAAQVRLTAPEWETRVAIVLDRIRRWGVEAVPEVASFLAGKLRTNLGQLDAVLTTLMSRPVDGHVLGDLDLVRQVLNDAGKRAIRVSPDDVIALVCRHFSIKLRDLRSAGRSPRVTWPRQIAMYLIRRYCGLSFPEIGRRFARHHTTALHSDRVVRGHMDHNGSLRAAVVLLEKELLRMSEERV